MSKAKLPTKQLRSNHRVVIEPRTTRSYGEPIPEDRIRAEAMDVIEAIKRHVDLPGRIEYEFDEQTVCEFCGSDPEPDANGYPQCCNRACNWADDNGLSPVPDPKPLKPSIPASAVCYFKDGDQWCCVHGDFVNLQESPAGFGESMGDALSALIKEDEKLAAQARDNLAAASK